MKNHQTRWRAVSALTAVALGLASVATGVGAATAAPARTAATSTDTTYLADTLGLPTDTVVETVTYDRFQWLLQQPGQFAFLVGDPVQTPAFKAQAVAVDAKARAAGVSKVYWFNPNLSGSVTIGSAAVPNLDIRNPSGITSIAAASQTIYGYAWTGLIGQYLGNGIKATVTGEGSESAKITTVANTTIINDVAAPLYDYSTGTPAAALHSTFFVYDKNNTTGTPAVADKLIAGIDLDADVDYANHAADAFTAVGASAIDAIGQFEFWKAEINKKHTEQSSNGPVVDGASVLDDSDNAEPWAVQQITYSELVHLLNLKDSASRNFVILFGGTWCPNTRAVIKDVNAEAQENDVTVYNFDTVLDGGTVGGATTSAVNPLQIRNTANNGSVLNANPSFLYGSVVSTYFKNIVTQYDNGTYITYFPNGDTTKAVLAVRKLQVPFLINYQRGAANNVPTATIKRQWIQQKTDASTGLPSFTEYMTQYRFARPSAGRIGLSNSAFPLALEIPGLAGFNWKSPVYPDRTTNADAAAYLDPAATDATTTPNALAAALAAVPNSSTLVTEADATTALATAQAASPVDAALVANLTIIKADWTLVQARKNSVSNALASTAFGLESVAKLGTFFDGLPGGVTSTQTVTAPDVAFGVAPSVTVAIANDYGRVPTGTVSLTVNGEIYTKAVANNAAAFTLPVLAAGSYGYSLSYPGDDQILPFSTTGSFSVAAKVETPVVKVAVGSITGAVGTAPTVSAGGTYGVTIAAPAGKDAATGSVTVTLTNGATSGTYAGTLSGGAVFVPVPKLAAGTWSVAVAYAGDANYLAASTTGSLVVAKATVAKIAGTVAKAPTSKKAGTYKVTVTSPAGLTAATGSVTIKLKNGSTTKTLTGKLSKGAVIVTVPKLKKGSWSVAISYTGDTTFAAASAKAKLKVAK